MHYDSYSQHISTITHLTVTGVDKNAWNPRKIYKYIRIRRCHTGKFTKASIKKETSQVWSLANEQEFYLLQIFSN